MIVVDKEKTTTSLSPVYTAIQYGIEATSGMVKCDKCGNAATKIFTLDEGKYSYIAPVCDVCNIIESEIHS